MSYHLRPKKFKHIQSSMRFFNVSDSTLKDYDRFESGGVILFVPVDSDRATVFYPAEYVKHMKAPLNERVRRFREINKWTQADLAKNAGVTQGEVSAIENGTASPGIKVIKKLQKAFKLDFQFFA